MQVVFHFDSLYITTALFFNTCLSVLNWVHLFINTTGFDTL
jgi:hypothetical protein